MAENNMPVTDNVVTVDGLWKKYSKRAEYAVQDVSFKVNAGEIVGILGHNGAGKSTTLKCLEGMLPFDKGSISICGYDVVKEPVKAKANMGFVTDDHAVFVKMTGIEYIDFMSDVYKVPQAIRQTRVDQLEKVFCLGDSIQNLISSYSHGMRQKICMMGSLIHSPKLWILDEPMTGLDPRSAHVLKELMRKHCAEGNSVFFSSHVLEVVEKLCDRLAIINRGRIIEVMSMDELKGKKEDVSLEEFFLSVTGGENAQEGI